MINYCLPFEPLSSRTVLQPPTGTGPELGISGVARAGCDGGSGIRAQ
jgi:hypothetical protein